MFDATISFAIGGFVLAGYPHSPVWARDGTDWRPLVGVPSGASSIWTDGTSQGALAFGCAEWTEPPDEVCQAYTMWHTADGSDWRPTLGVDLRNSVVFDVATNAGLSLAVGRTCPSRLSERPSISLFAIERGCQTPEAMLLSSRDGLHWTRLSGPPGSAGAGLEQIRPFRNGFVILGSAYRADNKTFVYTWASPDGANWSERALVPDAIDALLISGATGDSGLVIAGHDMAGVVVWTSSDGQQWSQYSTPSAFHGGDVMWLGRVGASIVAVGRATNPQKAAYIAIWVSSDGVSWTRANGPGDLYEEPLGNWPGRAVATDGKRIVIVAVGENSDGSVRDFHIWAGEPAA